MEMQTDPSPYIWSCYILGAIVIFGTYIWLAFATKKVKLLKSALNKELRQ